MGRNSYSCLATLLESVRFAIYDAAAARMMLIAAVLCAALRAETTCTHIQGGDGCSSSRDA